MNRPAADIITMHTVCKIMEQDRIVYFKTRKQWRRWLEKHFETEKEVWFVFPTVASGEKGVPYNDAVEEALCFGWIDGRAGAASRPAAKAVPIPSPTLNG